MDMETGLFGPGHFRRCLAREIRRADALAAPLSLALLRPSEAVEGDAAGVLVAGARHIYRNVRVLDHVFRAGRAELALIFSLPGSAAARICQRIQQDGLPVRFDHAIGSFPEDARSVAGLVAAAQAGLGRR